MDMAANTYLYEALTGAGIQPAGARQVERAIETAIEERQHKALGNVMTKEDGTTLGANLRTEIATVRTEVAVLTQRVTQIGLNQEAMRAEMHEKFMTKEDGATLGANLRTEIATVRTEIATVRTEIVTMSATLLKEQKAQMAWFVTLMFIAVGAATGGVELLHRLWP